MSAALSRIKCRPAWWLGLSERPGEIVRISWRAQNSTCGQRHLSANAELESGGYVGVQQKYADAGWFAWAAKLTKITKISGQKR